MVHVINVLKVATQIYGDYNKPIIRIAINQSGFPMVQPSAVLEPSNWGGWESHARTLHSELPQKTSGTEKMEVFVVQVLRYYPVQVLTVAWWF